MLMEVIIFRMKECVWQIKESTVTSWEKTQKRYCRSNLTTWNLDLWTVKLNRTEILEFWKHFWSIINFTFSHNVFNSILKLQLSSYDNFFLKTFLKQTTLTFAYEEKYWKENIISMNTFWKILKIWDSPYWAICPWLLCDVYINCLWYSQKTLLKYVLALKFIPLYPFKANMQLECHGHYGPFFSFFFRPKDHHLSTQQR